MLPKIVSLVGITASGKSGLGILLAQKYNGEIVSCDSRQVYRDLDIGTAKVTATEQSLVRHHMIDIVDPGSHFDVFEYQKLAQATIDDILSRSKLPILVGGTGLYSRSIVEGYTFGRPNQNAPNDLLPAPKYDVCQICLLPTKEYIRPIIEKRIDTRLEQGMIEETKNLLAAGVSKPWLQSLGLEYYWNIELLDGKISLNEYKRQLATKTMQYAKRQQTWFKRERNTHFLTDPETFLSDTDSIIKEFIS